MFNAPKLYIHLDITLKEFEEAMDDLKEGDCSLLAAGKDRDAISEYLHELDAQD